MWDRLAEWASNVVAWAASKPNRLRLKGARIEVIAMILSRTPSPQVLLGESRYGVWMLPQEGVSLKESFTDALIRCLREECGIDVPEVPALRRQLFYLHSIKYLDSLKLPQSRIGERPVADDAPGTAFENVQLRKKAYWLATVIVKSPSDFPAKADGIELTKVAWFSLAEARAILSRTNDEPKAGLLALCVDQAEKVLKSARQE